MLGKGSFTSQGAGSREGKGSESGFLWKESFAQANLSDKPNLLKFQLHLKIVLLGEEKQSVACL